MHESERLLFAVAADAEQLAGGMPGQLQRKNQKTENWTRRSAGRSMPKQLMRRAREKRAAGRTVSTRVVMFMMLFNGFTVEGDPMASAAS